MRRWSMVRVAVKFAWTLGSISPADAIRAMLDISSRWRGPRTMIGAGLKLAALVVLGWVAWAVTGDGDRTFAIVALAALATFAAGRVYRR